MAELSPVLAAFIQGSREKDSLAQQSFQNEQQLAQKDLEKQKLAEDIKNHKELLDLSSKQFLAQQAQDKAAHELQVHGAKMAMLKNYLETGIKPEESNAELQQNYPDRTQIANENAKLSTIENVPKLDLFKQQQDALNQNKIEQLNTAGALKQTADEIGNQFKAKQAREKAQADLDRELQVARLKGGFDIQKANIAAQAGLEKIATKQAQLTPADQIKMDSLDSLQKDLTTAKQILEQTNYGYYQGPSGILTNLQSKAAGGETDPTMAQLKTVLGNLRNDYVVAEAGKSLTSNELNLINTHIPDVSHFQSPNEVKAQIEYLAQKLGELKVGVLSKYGSPSKTTNTATTAPVGKKVDPNAAFILSH